jgi:hypothetical protein
MDEEMSAGILRQPRISIVVGGKENAEEAEVAEFSQRGFDEFRVLSM